MLVVPWDDVCAAHYCLRESLRKQKLGVVCCGGRQGNRPLALNVKAWLPAPQPPAGLEDFHPWKWVQHGQGPTLLGWKGSRSWVRGWGRIS